MTTLPLPPQSKDSKGFWGEVFLFNNNRLGQMRTWAQQAPILRVRFGNIWQTIVSQPSAAMHVLQNNSRAYGKEQFLMRVVRTALGEAKNNVFTADGQDWLRRRRMMQPAFHRQQIHNFGEIITGQTQKHLNNWEAKLAQNQPIDLETEMALITLDIITRAMFGNALGDSAPAIREATAYVSDFVAAYAQEPLRPPLWVPTAAHRRYKSSIRLVADKVRQIIRSRQNAPVESATPDLLDMLMAARDQDDGQGFSMADLIAEMQGVVLAGHETTSTALTWALILLAQHPEVEARLHAEVDSAWQGSAPTMETLANLSYTRQVFLEAIRLFPPAWITTRQALEADQIDGFGIPKNEIIIVNIYALHHAEQFWQDAEVFRPERFANENYEKGAYLPFGAGPRKCIGEPLAMAEGMLILAMIVRQYRLRLVGEAPTPQPRFILHPKNRVEMRLERR